MILNSGAICETCTPFPWVMMAFDTREFSTFLWVPGMRVLLTFWHPPSLVSHIIPTNTRFFPYVTARISSVRHFSLGACQIVNAYMVTRKICYLQYVSLAKIIPAGVETTAACASTLPQNVYVGGTIRLIFRETYLGVFDLRISDRLRNSSFAHGWWLGCDRAIKNWYQIFVDICSLTQSTFLTKPSNLSGDVGIG